MAKQREGYLLIDHKDSPGITEAQAHTSGLPNMPAVKSGQRFESATVTCCHCNTVVILNPDRTRPRGYCQKCDQYVCDSPACNAECIPWAKIVDEFMEKAHANPLGV